MRRDRSLPRASMDFRALPPQRRQDIGRRYAGPDTRLGSEGGDSFRHLPPFDCNCQVSTLTISKVDGVEALRTITDVSLRVPDGDYRLTVAGEAFSSRW